ncbi:MAG: ABC transporter ATP-binding protein [Microthrixaceae bacterium]|nr:ABC transporter ATP-binding protein [Microthrixaceae bacterium]
MALLETRGLSVRFGGHLAVSSVDLDVESGVVTGLIGPNGAGKTTTFNLICGVLGATGGRVIFDGRPIGSLSTHYRARLGIGRTFQRLEVFGSMTVRENVLVGAEIRQAWARFSHVSPQLLADGEELPLGEEVELLVERLGLAAVADVRVGELPTGQARLVEIARALAIRPRVLLLDEPASGLDDTETGHLGELMQQLAASGLAILLVEHDVPLVMKVCAQVNVLDFGQVIARGTPSEIQANEVVQAAYLGGS